MEYGRQDPASEYVPVLLEQADPAPDGAGWRVLGAAQGAGFGYQREPPVREPNDPAHDQLASVAAVSPALHAPGGAARNHGLGSGAGGHRSLLWHLRDRIFRHVEQPHRRGTRRAVRHVSVPPDRTGRGSSMVAVPARRTVLGLDDL